MTRVSVQLVGETFKPYLACECFAYPYHSDSTREAKMIREAIIWDSSVFEKSFQSYYVGPAHVAAFIDSDIKRLL